MMYLVQNLKSLVGRKSSLLGSLFVLKLCRATSILYRKIYISILTFQEKRGNDDDGGMDGKEKFKARNWTTFKKTEKDIKKMPPQLKSRYLAVSFLFVHIQSLY